MSQQTYDPTVLRPSHLSSTHNFRDFHCSPEECAEQVTHLNSADFPRPHVKTCTRTWAAKNESVQSIGRTFGSGFEEGWGKGSHPRTGELADKSFYCDTRIKRPYVKVRAYCKRIERKPTINERRATTTVMPTPPIDNVIHKIQFSMHYCD